MNFFRPHSIVFTALLLGLVFPNTTRGANAIPPGMESMPPADIGRALDRDASASNRERLAAGKIRYDRRMAQRSAYIANFNQNVELATKETQGIVVKQPAQDKAASRFLVPVIWATALGITVLWVLQSRRREQSG